MEKENPRIRPIKELIGENFFIPRYQRGYRWGKQEIDDLLDDIFQYYSDLESPDTSKKVGGFYCLQPIVVKAKRLVNDLGEEIDAWELIDGQQRLTSLFIILTYLEDIRQCYDNKIDIFTIDFETRENCNQFFRDKKFVDKIDSSNVDFYHISKAYEYVKDWFKDKLIHRFNILKTILSDKNNVSIIWYETKESDNILNKEIDSIDLFTRLNEGKIPLTDAELIKALLLQADRYPESEERYVKQRLFEMASEWDEIESNLNDEKMWLFLNDTEYKPSSKIEFLFKLLADKWNYIYSEKLIKKDDKGNKPKHFEYLVFDRYLSIKKKEYIDSDKLNKDVLDPINEIWGEIKEIYSVFREWYVSHSLYHYIGYLLAINTKGKEKIIKELLDKQLSKSEFEKYLIRKIAQEISIIKKKEDSQDLKVLSDLSYGYDNNEIIKILLLFNIDTLVKHNKENTRFPFHLYKKEKISSIEHIHPQNPENVDTDEERSKVWLKSHIQTLNMLSSRDDADSVQISMFSSNLLSLSDDFDKDKFKSIYHEIIEFYSKLSDIKENERHSLYNLALVDKDTNSKLNNSFFDIKRNILKNNKLEKYIPICTQRVFSKYYSSSSQELIFWNNNDREAYFKEIELMYNKYIKTLN